VYPITLPTTVYVLDISIPLHVQNPDHKQAAKLIVMAPMGSIRGTMPQDIVLIFMGPWVIAPTAAKMEKEL
jgi:hypothetical protein